MNQPTRAPLKRYEINHDSLIDPESFDLRLTVIPPNTPDALLMSMKWVYYNGVCDALILLLERLASGGDVDEACMPLIHEVKEYLADLQRSNVHGGEA